MNRWHMLAAACLISCGEHAGESGAPTLYVANAVDGDGDRSSMAFIEEGGRFTAYVCPDDPEHAEYAGWFRGTLDANGAVSARRDDWTLTADPRGDRVDVTVVSPAGEQMHFAAARVKASGLTGLYAAGGDACTTGVIVIDDGAGLIVHGASCDEAGHALQVTPALPVALVGGRLPVDVRTGAASRRLLVAPLHGPGS